MTIYFKKLIILLFCVCIGYEVNSQVVVKIKIENSVCSSCLCSLTKAGKVIFSKVSDANGSISFLDSVYNDADSLRINLGNNIFCSLPKQMSIQPYVYTCKEKDITLGSTTLKEVEIIAKEPVIDDEGGKLTYNVQKDLGNSTVNSSDILRRTPMVSIDLNGSPSIRGNSNVLVMVNGRPITGLSASQIIEQIPANQIVKIEVITSPDAKYDADGTGGVINIITRERINFKSSGYLNLGLGSTGSHLFANYIYSINSNWTISNYVNGLAYYNKISGKRSYENQYSELNLNSKGSTLGKLYGYQFTLSKSTDRDKLNINFNFYGQMEDFKEKNRIENTEMDLKNSLQKKYSYYRVSSDYERKVSDKVKANISIAASNLPLSNLLERDSDTIRNSSNISNGVFSFDLENKLGRKVVIETGAKANANSFETSSSENDFKALQYLLATYVNGKIKITNKFNTTIGLRVEDYHFIAQEDQIFKHYTSPFFNGSINYKVNNRSSLSLLYNQRAGRPSYSNLLPIKSNSNSNIIASGNPDLKQEMSNNFEISFSTHIGSCFIKISPLYKFFKDKISNFMTVDAGSFTSSVINLSRQTEYGASLFFSSNFLQDKLSLNIGTDYIQRELTYDKVQKKGTQILGNFSVSYKIIETISINLFGSFSTPSQYIQGQENSFNYSNVSIQKDFTKRNFKLAISVDNPFSKGFLYKQNLELEGYIYRNSVQYYNRGVRIFFIYKFGRDKNSQKEYDSNNQNSDILKNESTN